MGSNIVKPRTTWAFDAFDMLERHVYKAPWNLPMGKLMRR